MIRASLFLLLVWPGVLKNALPKQDIILIPDSIFSINIAFCLLLVAGVAVVSLLAGLWPANRAASVDPVKAR